MPSIGKDLVKIRKHLGLTLQDIQFATKLPQHTLEKIEDDTIFVDAEEGPIYTRNFVRSYGRVLKIDDDTLIEALDQREAGKYSNLLLRQYPALSEELPEHDKSGSEAETTETESESAAETEKESDNISAEDEKKTGESDLKDQKENDSDDAFDESAPETTGKKKESVKTSEKKDASTQETSKKQAAASEPVSVNKKSKKKGGAAEKSTKEVDWAGVGQKISQEKKQAPVWLIGLIILLIILGAAGYFIVQSGLLSGESSTQEEITTPPEDPGSSSLSIELDEPEPQPRQEITGETPVTPQPVVALDDTLTIVVYAAFGNVDPVRVWSDTKPRFDPYWIEEGNAMIFDFEDTVQIRGPYDNMLLFFNGHLIENAVQNFFNEGENYVELNRSDFTSDSKWSENTDLQVPEGVEPPEDTRSRPTF